MAPLIPSCSLSASDRPPVRFVPAPFLLGVLCVLSGFTGRAHAFRALPAAASERAAWEASQDTARSDQQENVLKINTLSLFLGTGSVFYERKLREDRSFQLGTAYLQYKFDETTFSGLILTPEMRFYPKSNALSGFYTAPYLRLQRYMVKSGDGKGVYRNVGGGMLVGRQWVNESDFTMDLFFGGHYGRGSVDVDDGRDSDFETETFEGFRVRVGFAIGFAF